MGGRFVHTQDLSNRVIIKPSKDLLNPPTVPIRIPTTTKQTSHLLFCSATFDKVPSATLHSAFAGVVRPEYSTIRQHRQPGKPTMACRAISLLDTLAAAASRPSLSNWSRCKIISNRTQLSGDSATEKTRLNLIGVRGGWIRGLPGRRLTGSVILAFQSH